MALVDIYARHADDGHAWIPKPINKQGPLLNYDATLKEVYELLTIYPQVWIYDSATKKAINLSNLSEYFPDYDPGGGVTPEQLATALQGKVDKVTGKGLSTNDYATEDKTKLAGLSNYDDTQVYEAINSLDRSIGTVGQAVEGKVDKVNGKTLSTNDYTNADKQKVQSALTKEQFDAGKTVTGTQYVINNVTVTAGKSAEIFNDYAYNIASGGASHAEGSGTTASGPCSHAEGSGTTASESCSHAEGGGTTASGTCSHAEGSITNASGPYSHAEGTGTTASAFCSHSEGQATNALGPCSHAEGSGTTASGPCSHAEGSGTIALSASQHVQGKYNIEDANNKYAFIIGNGTSKKATSNAFAIDWSGLIYQNNSENGVDLNQMSEKMNKTLTTWKGTQAEYDALESKSEYDMYYIYEDDET